MPCRRVSLLLAARCVLWPWLLALGVSAARADEIQVAVAANFAGPFAQIASAFSAASGHRLVVATGSTGKFHTQILHGAPFAVLLAADEDTPRKLVDEGLAVKGSAFTYAIGKLVLWSAQPGVVDGEGEVLKKAAFQRLAVANPKLAPYGAAGIETLKALGVYETVAGRIVEAENIAQAHQFVATGNAEIGFVALSQVATPAKPPTGSYWLVPPRLYTPIRQDAVLLTAGATQPAALALMRYLKTDGARALIQSWGYGL